MYVLPSKALFALSLSCFLFACSESETPASSAGSAGSSETTGAEVATESSSTAEAVTEAVETVEAGSSSEVPAKPVFTGNQVAEIINDGYQAPALVPEAAAPLKHKVVSQEEMYKDWPYTEAAAEPSMTEVVTEKVESKVSEAAEVVENKLVDTVAEVSGQSKSDVVAAVAAAKSMAGGEAAATGGAEHVVNAKGLTAFDRPIIYIAPGDTVHFKKLNGGHNSESVLVPDGAEGWKGAMNQNISVTLTVPGIYGYLCLPHAGLGMNGVIVVGDAGPKEAVMEKLRGLPQTDFSRKLLGKVNKVKPEMYVK